MGQISKQNELTNDQKISIEVLQDCDRNLAHALLCTFKEESQSRSPVYDELRPDYRDVLARYIDEYQSRSDCTIFVAKVHGTLIGFIMGSLWKYLPIYTSEHMGYIPELYVASEFRGRGVGRALIRAMEQWFREQGMEFSRIETICAYERNQSLYEALGYELFLLDLRRKLE
jgi:aminoglycoside 6'-N-acetyltransferase I